MSDEIKTPELTNEMVFKFLTENEDGKKWLQSKLDAYATKGIKSYEENFMKEKFPKILDEEISKRYPAETPEQKRLKELELKFTQVDNEKKKAQLQSALLKKATEKQLPDFLVDYAIDEDEEKSTIKLYDLGNKYNDLVNKAVEERLKGTGRKAPIDTGLDINNVSLKDLPNNDPEFYKKNAAVIDKLMNQ